MRIIFNAGNVGFYLVTYELILLRSLRGRDH